MEKGAWSVMQEGGHIWGVAGEGRRGVVMGLGAWFWLSVEEDGGGRGQASRAGSRADSRPSRVS